MVNVVYIHGFNSAAKPETVEALNKVLNTVDSTIDYRITNCPTWDCGSSYDANVRRICQYVESLDRDDDLVLIGCSLGGFYSRHVASVVNCRAVLINPVVNPATQLRSMIGFHENYVTGDRYEFTESLLNSYKPTEITRGLVLTYVSDTDELLVNNGKIVDANRGLFGKIIHTNTTHRIVDYTVLPDFKKNVDRLVNTIVG